MNSALHVKDLRLNLWGLQVGPGEKASLKFWRILSCGISTSSQQRVLWLKGRAVYHGYNTALIFVGISELFGLTF